MSLTVHPELSEFPRKALKSPIIGYAKSQPAGVGQNGWHSHDTAQLFHVVKGSLAIETEAGTFFAPPERAVWLPPRVAHETRYLSDTEIRFIYVQYDFAQDLPQTPQVIQVTTLLRALILEFMSYPRAETETGPAARIASVILDQLKMLPAAPLQLPMPQEARLRSLCEGIVRCPAHIPSLPDAAQRCATSVRSFERRMKAETGLSYRTWCRQVKLFRALELLAAGRSVSNVSDKLGYEGPSAFVAAFKKAFGVTPGRYF
ncbi:AraC family transcriptional regulator [Roseibium denhamense]|uniref:Transcriptional regulator, AraC family n=1 Tax=Roseibium denhamense TaxID=76305 RepID=A0ABY1N8C5_9HYPH|nr:helix-turn-helix transcriptional regulator [Roseibium denhamense]MTI05617.1 AraC family transcriptional regulator [Roseibium denhamense]SMP03214.1 transcriptional regulator, AraC family [Roseibium denhamense]